MRVLHVLTPIGIALSAVFLVIAFVWALMIAKKDS